MGTEASKKDVELRRLLSLEYQVGPQVPKTFLWHTWTDQSVPVENSLLLLQALRKAGVNVEAHLYPMGPHGIALGTEETQGIGQKYLAPYCESWMAIDTPALSANSCWEKQMLSLIDLTLLQISFTIHSSENSYIV